MRVLGLLASVAIVAATALATTGGASAPPLSAGSVPADIKTILDKPRYSGAIWGLRVLEGKNVLVDYNSDQKFFIGSVRKVFTIGQLLEAVGPAHTYDTPVYKSGNNLVLVASGDLTMGGRTNPDGSIAISDWDHNEADSLGNAILTKPDPLAGYISLAKQVKAAGITHVTGDVIVDDRLFPPFGFRGEFNVRPIFVNDDAVDLTITPGGKPGGRTNLTYRPHSAALAIDNLVRNSLAGGNNTLKIDPQTPRCIGEAGCIVTVDGELPVNFAPPLTGKRELVQTVRIVQPSNYARSVFVEALQAEGVKVDAPLVARNPTALLPAKNSYKSGDRVALLRGMPYGEEAKFIDKISYNIGADTSLILLGLTKGAETMDSALAAEKVNLAKHYGIAGSSYRFYDGSGGGNADATNGAVTQFLLEASHRKYFPALYDSLPILSVDGSLAFVKEYQKDATLAGAAGKVHAKTGTFVAPDESGGIVLKGQALAGYVTTKSGKKLVFQIVVNNVPIGGVDDITHVFQDEGSIAAMLWRDF